MKDLRRSGRFKSKGPVVEENTPSDAYSVDDESSGDDFVDSKGKGLAVDTQVLKIGSGSNVKASDGDKGINIIARNVGVVKKRKKTDKIGGESSKSVKSKSKKEKPRKKYTFQTRTSPKTLYNAIVTLKPLQKACLARIGFADLLEFKADGIPSKLGFYVVDNFHPTEMEIRLEKISIFITKQLIGGMLGISNNGVDIMAEQNETDSDMINCWYAQFDEDKEITPSYLKFMIRKSKVADMNFKLNFILLFTSVMGCVKPSGICDLSVLYKITRKTELSQINWCEYIWNCLKKCKDAWNRTMSNSFFRGPITLLTMLYVDGTVCNEFNVGRKRPPTTLWTMELLKERENEEILAGGIGKCELQGPFVEEEEPMPEDEVGFLWKLNKYVDNIRKERDGFQRTFAAASELLPGNQLVTDVFQQYRASLQFIDGGAGVTPNSVQTKPNIDATDVDINSNGGQTPDWGPLTQQEVIRSVDKETDVAIGRAKRKYTKSQVFRSPYMSRVSDITASESKEETKVERFLLNQPGIDQSAILFETESGTKVSRYQMASLVNGGNIDISVVNGWSEYLNSLEEFKAENSFSRFFLPTFVVDKKLFVSDANAKASVTKYLMDLENVNAIDGRKNMINHVDLVFIPVNNYGHQFLLCFNLKYPAVDLIDGKNNLTKAGLPKRVPVTSTNDISVSSIVHARFGKYLVRLNHSKAAAILGADLTREDFYWQTDKRPNDFGVFLMRHMEAYMGSLMNKWSCGLEKEGKKQNTLLDRLRKRYAATLVLSKSNIHSDSIRAQLGVLEAADVPAKKMKLPKRGK